MTPRLDLKDREEVVGVGAGKVSQTEERVCAKVSGQEVRHFID